MFFWSFTGVFGRLRVFLVVWSDFGQFSYIFVQIFNKYCKSDRNVCLYPPTVFLGKTLRKSIFWDIFGKHVCMSNHVVTEELNRNREKRSKS
jgi:hypothetical protein